jgi:hypothetical protein
MKKYLLRDAGNFYKANLHCHTTLSDGNWTPEKMKDEYKKRGYHIIAMSDHDVLRCNYHLSDDNFLVLTAYEVSIKDNNENIPFWMKKIVDINLIAKEPYLKTQVGFNPDVMKWHIENEKITQEEADNIEYYGGTRPWGYSPEFVKKIIEDGKKNNFLVAVNHPMWSLASSEDYKEFDNAWAIEVYNHGCASLSGLSDSESLYEEMLRSGIKLFALATDDNHNYFDDSFGGFTMIKAENLEYRSIIDALEKGEFYASCGPLIKEIYYEDGKVHISCSEAAEISMLNAGRRGRCVLAKDGKMLTEAVFEINRNNCFDYIRFRVVDKKGKKAYTNAYYFDEFAD